MRRTLTAAVLRWILVLPTVWVVHVIAERWIEYQNYRGLGTSEYLYRNPANLVELLMLLAYCFVPPLLAVLAGTAMAPAHQRWAAIAVALLVSALHITLMWLLLASASDTVLYWSDYVLGPLGVAGAITGGAVAFRLYSRSQAD